MRIVNLEVTEPQHSIITSPKSRNLSQYGQGGGKTFSMGVLAGFFIKNCPKSLGLIAANSYMQLSDSTLKEIFEVWKTYFGWTEFSDKNPGGNFVIDKKPPAHFKPHGHTFKKNSNKIFFRNGAVIMTVSLDNYKAIEGRTIAWALLDETTDTKMEAVKEVITGRLREESIALNTKATKDQFQFIDADDPRAGKVRNPLFIFTKPSKEQWLNEFFELERFRTEIQAKIFSKTEYFEKDFDNKRVVIASAFFNSRNLPDEYFKDRMRELSKDLIDMLIYGSPFGKSGAEYYMTFSYDNNVAPVKYIPNQPIHLTFDFNVNPYMTAQVWQVIDEDDVVYANCLKEYAMTTPKNTIEDTCRQFLEDWEHLCYPGLFYYGDVSGKNKQPVKTLKSYFSIVENELKTVTSRRSRRLLKANPRHKTVGRGTLGRREFMLKMIKGNSGVKVRIHPDNKHTIADLMYIRENKNGAKLKEIATINEVKCEKYGHMSDAMDAIICYLFGEYKRE